jgi:hypothetical protein
LEAGSTARGHEYDSAAPPPQQPTPSTPTAAAMLPAAVACLDFDVGTMVVDGMGTGAHRRSWPRPALRRYLRHLGRRLALAALPAVLLLVLILYSSVSSLLGYQLLVSTTWYLLNTMQVREGVGGGQWFGCAGGGGLSGVGGCGVRRARWQAASRGAQALPPAWTGLLLAAYLAALWATRGTQSPGWGGWQLGCPAFARHTRRASARVVGRSTVGGRSAAAALAVSRLPPGCPLNHPRGGAMCDTLPTAFVCACVAASVWPRWVVPRPQCLVKCDVASLAHPPLPTPFPAPAPSSVCDPGCVRTGAGLWHAAGHRGPWRERPAGPCGAVCSAVFPVRGGGVHDRRHRQHRVVCGQRLLGAVHSGCVCVCVCRVPRCPLRWCCARVHACGTNVRACTASALLK